MQHYLEVIYKGSAAHIYLVLCAEIASMGSIAEALMTPSQEADPSNNCLHQERLQLL